MRLAPRVLPCMLLTFCVSLSAGCGGGGATGNPDFGAEDPGGAAAGEVAPEGGVAGEEVVEGGGEGGVAGEEAGAEVGEAAEGGPGDEGDEGGEGGEGGEGVEPECALDETEDQPCGLNERGASTRACEDGVWGEFGDCVDTDACLDGGREGQACGFNDGGSQLRDCIDGQWGEFADCDDPDECVEGADEVVPCGLNDRGEQIRSCEEGAWGDFEDCVDPDGCEDDAREEGSCGFNDNGIDRRICVEGAWGDFEDCVDPDDCENDTEEEEACGLNDRGTHGRRCDNGAWGDFGGCVDPDFCEDDAVEEQPCGLNDRGARARSCTEGRWSGYGECVDPDECPDDDDESEDCGLNNRGERTRVCVAGVWGQFDACADPDECVDDEGEAEDCGLNDRGTRSRTCGEGQWRPFGACADPDECVDAADEEEPCGFNGRSTHTRSCAAGQWSQFQGCQDPDECVDDVADLRDCGPVDAGGQQARLCPAGHWTAWRACVDGQGVPLLWDGALDGFEFDLPDILHLTEQDAAIRSVFELPGDFDVYGQAVADGDFNMLLGAYRTDEDGAFRPNQPGGALASMTWGFAMDGQPDAQDPDIADGDLLGIHRRGSLVFSSRGDGRLARFDRRSVGSMRAVIGHHATPEGDGLAGVHWEEADAVNPVHQFEICEPELFEGAVDSFDIGAGRVLQTDEDNAAIRVALPDAEFRLDLDIAKPGADFWSVFGVYDADEANLFDEGDARGGMDDMATSISVDLQNNANGAVRVAGGVAVDDVALVHGLENGDLWSLLGLGDEVAVLRNGALIHTADRPGRELHVVLAHHGAPAQGGFVRCNFVTGAAVGDGTPLPECRNDDLEERDCGLNDRGVQERTCVDRRWTVWGQCADPDICSDDVVQGRACGLNDRGNQNRGCDNGQWTVFEACDDPDVCTDEAFQELSCGFNDRGDQNRTCVAGAWADFTVCEDPDVCEDAAVERRACGGADQGLQERSCVTGQWLHWRACLDDDGNALVWEGRTNGFGFDFPDIRHRGQLNAAIRSVETVDGDFDIYATAETSGEFYMLLGAYAADEDGQFNSDDSEAGAGNMVRAFILDASPNRMNPDVVDGELFGVHRRRGLMFFSRDDGRFRRFVRRSAGEMRALIGHHNVAGDEAWADVGSFQGDDVNPTHRWHTCEPELWEGAVDGFDLPGGRILHVGGDNSAIRTSLPDADFRLDVSVSMADGVFWSGFGVYAAANADLFDANDARGGLDDMPDSVSVDLQTSGNSAIRVGGVAAVQPLHPDDLNDDDEWSLLADGGSIIVLRNESEVARADRPAGELDLVFGHHGVAEAGGFIDCQFVTGAAVGDFTPLPQCQNDDVEVIRCGINDRGGSERTCVDQRWTSFSECDDPDECVDADAEDQDCGLNSRGVETRTCVEGSWSDFEACDDPDECIDDATEDQACGLNQRGIQTRTCDLGAWSAFAACEDPDECVDDDEEERICGADDVGTQGRTCTVGQWRPWRVCVDVNGEPVDWTGRLAGFSFDEADIGQVGDNNAAIRSVRSMDGDFDLYASVVAIDDFFMSLGAFPASRDGSFDADDAYGAIDAMPLAYLIDAQPGAQDPEVADGEMIGLHRRRNLFFVSRDEGAYLRYDERTPTPMRLMLGHHNLAADGDAWGGVAINEGADLNSDHQFHVCEPEAFEGATDSFTLGRGRVLQLDAANAAIRTQLPPSDFRIDVKVRLGDGDFYSVFGVYPSVEDGTFSEDDAYGDLDLMDDSLFVDLQTSGNAGIREGAEVVVGDLHPNLIVDGDFWSLLGQGGDIVVLRNDVEMHRIVRPADDLKLVFGHHGAGPSGGFVECRWATGAAMGPAADRLAICDEEEVQERGCALGDAGTEGRTCVDGGWEPWTACLGPDDGPLVWEGRAAGFDFAGDDIGHLDGDDAGAAIRTHSAFEGDFDLTGEAAFGDSFLLNLGAYSASEDATFDFDDPYGAMASMTESYFFQGGAGGGVRTGAAAVDTLHGGVLAGDTWGVHRRRGTLFFSKNSEWFHTMDGTVTGDARGVLGHSAALGDGVWNNVVIARAGDVDPTHSVGSCEEDLFSGSVAAFSYADGRIGRATADQAAVSADMAGAEFQIDVAVDRDAASRFFMTFGVYSAADHGSFDGADALGGLEDMATSISVDLSDGNLSGIRVGGTLCVANLGFFAQENSVWSIVGRNGTIDVEVNDFSVFNFCPGIQVPPPVPAGALKVMFGNRAADLPGGAFHSCKWRTGAALPD